MGKTILITGGQRSGKSEFAERLALSMSDRPVYIATARIYDEEFRRRVEAHKARRGPCWTSVEEPLYPSRYSHTGATVLLDCITLWATNMFFEHGEDVNKAYAAFCNEFDAFVADDADYILVTNEIGMGGTSDNPMQRRFTDLQGLVNRYVAEKSDEVYLLISGIDVKIKG